MDLTHLPFLTDDELTTELKIRGLPDVGTMMEKRNVLSGILSSSLAATFPVRQASPTDDQYEYTVCQRKLQDMSGTLLTLFTSPDSDFNKFNARLAYLKERVMRITTSELRNRLLVIWAQLLGDFNSKRDTIRRCPGDLLSFDHELPTIAPPAESTQNDISFVDRISQLELSTVAQPDTVTRAPPVCFANPVYSPVRAMPVAASTTAQLPAPLEPTPYFNPSAQVSRWNISFDGSDSVNDFIERAEETAKARGITHDQLFRQSSDLFRGQALVWHRQVRNEVNTWPELVNRLRVAFLPSDYEYELWDEIRARTQGQTERTEIYVAVMQSLFGRFSYVIDESTRLQLIMRNLQPRFQTEISVTQSSTIQQLLAICKLMEDAAHRAAKFKNPPPRSNSLLEPGLAYRRERITVHQSETFSTSVCWNCDSPGHRSASCPEPRKKHCYSCGKKDVTRWSCKDCSSRKPKNAKHAAVTSTDGRDTPK